MLPQNIISLSKSRFNIIYFILFIVLANLSLHKYISSYTHTHTRARAGMTLISKSQFHRLISNKLEIFFFYGTRSNFGFQFHSRFVDFVIREFSCFEKTMKYFQIIHFLKIHEPVRKKKKIFPRISNRIVNYLEFEQFFHPRCIFTVKCIGESVKIQRARRRWWKCLKGQVPTFDVTDFTNIYS